MVRAMERMRELVQQSTSSSTELAAAAEQMSKLSRNLLESMDRFVSEKSASDEQRRAPNRRPALESQRMDAATSTPKRFGPKESSSAIMEKELQVVGFRIGRETFGLPIAMVREIVRVPEITSVPNAPEYIEGVINLRGRIIPVVDLAEALRRSSRCAQQERIASSSWNWKRGSSV